MNEMTDTLPPMSASNEAPARAAAGIGRGPAVMILLVVGFCAAYGRVGADCLWLVALGDHILESGQVPDGIPFAGAPTQDWPNVLVAAELIFALVHRMGTSALLGMQLVCTAVMLSLTALGAHRLGARNTPTALILGLLAAGAITSFVIVRLQVLSLVPFALLLLLLRAEHERPGKRIWLLVPLFAIWGNLHGAVLVGTAVAGCYLAFARFRREPPVAVAVAVCSCVALWATPAGLHTPSYYLGVFANEAARRGTDLWTRPDLSDGFDLMLVGVAITFVILTLRTRQPIWEYVALVGLAVGTATAARHGVWLLLFAAGPAAANFLKRPVPDNGYSRHSRTIPLGVVAVLVISWLVWQRGATILPPGTTAVPSVTEVAGGRPVLAPEPIVESLAVAGARVWVSDPIDAFARADQSAYLDFLGGQPGAGRALDAVELVLVPIGSGPESIVRTDRQFKRLMVKDGWALYERQH